MDNAKIIGMRVLIMSVILIIGAVCYKRKIITASGTKQLSAVELNIVNPLMIFMSYQSEYDPQRLKGLLWSFMLAAVSFAVVIPLAGLLKRSSNENYAVERFSCIYSNCGFMGIPLINALYGSDGVLYLTAYITLFNLLVFTHGYMLMKEEHDMSAFKKAVTSPTIIAIIIGVIFYVLGIRLANMTAVGGVVADAFRFIADMNTPLAMLIAGATAAQSDFLKSLLDKHIMLTAFYKLMLLPACVVVLIHFLPRSQNLMPELVVCIACACPAATTGMMFALLFDKNAKRCSEIFAVTTILSMATLPLMTAFATALV